MDLARKTVSDSFTLDDDLVAEFCKHRIAEILIAGKNKNCIFNKRGFIPKERSFALNADRPIYLIGKGDQQFYVITDFKQHDVTVGSLAVTDKRYGMNLEIDAQGEWRESIPVPPSLLGEDVKLVVKYTPTPIRK